MGISALTRCHELTEQQLKFCEEYLINGGVARPAAIKAEYAENSAATTAHYLLNKTAVRNYLDKRIREVTKNIQEKTQVTFDYKISKLKKVVDLTIPEEAETMKQIGAREGIAAIGELNKMQGHYAVEKILTTTHNINSDEDLKQINELTQELIEEKKSGY